MEDGGQVDPESKIRLVVPNSSCGGIIGKAGAIIRSVCLFYFFVEISPFKLMLYRYVTNNDANACETFNVFF